MKNLGLLDLERADVPPESVQLERDGYALLEGVFGAASSWILLYDAGAKQLRTVCSRGRGSEAFRDLGIAPDVGILGLAFTNRKVVFVPNVKDDDRWFDAQRVHAVLE